MDEIKQGYKLTDIGVIPEDWEQLRFNNITTAITCGVAATPIYVHESVGKLFLSASNVQQGKVILRENKYISKTLYNQITKHNKPEKGDILYTRVGAGIGEAGVIDFDLDFAIYVSLTLIKVRPSINSYFIKHVLNSEFYKSLAKNSQFAGGGVQNLNVNVVREFSIPVPKLEEQTAIATALSDTDALIAALDKKITKKRQIKQGAMQKLLTGKMRLPGFSGKWVEKRVDEFSDTSSGGTPSRSNSNFYTGNIPWVTTGELNDGYISCTKEYISEEALNCSSAKLFPVDTVLMAMYGATIGKLGIINIPASTNQACCAFLCDDQLVDNKFLFYKLRFIRNELISLGSGAGQPNISQTIIKNLSLSMPNTKSEQTAIAQILTDMDNEIAQLEKERDKYKELKAGMMQVLLTGKVRLV